MTSVLFSIFNGAMCFALYLEMGKALRKHDRELLEEYTASIVERAKKIREGSA